MNVRYWIASQPGQIWLDKVSETTLLAIIKEQEANKTIVLCDSTTEDADDAVEGDAANKSGGAGGVGRAGAGGSTSSVRGGKGKGRLARKRPRPLSRPSVQHQGGNRKNAAKGGGQQQEHFGDEEEDSDDADEEEEDEEEEGEEGGDPSGAAKGQDDQIAKVGGGGGNTQSEGEGTDLEVPCYFFKRFPAHGEWRGRATSVCEEPDEKGQLLYNVEYFVEGKDDVWGHHTTMTKIELLKHRKKDEQNTGGEAKAKVSIKGGKNAGVKESKNVGRKAAEVVAGEGIDRRAAKEFWARFHAEDGSFDRKKYERFAKGKYVRRDGWKCRLNRLYIPKNASSKTRKGSPAKASGNDWWVRDIEHEYKEHHMLLPRKTYGVEWEFASDSEEVSEGAKNIIMCDACERESEPIYGDGPGQKAIPEGNWYCCECETMNAGSSICGDVLHSSNRTSSQTSNDHAK